MKAVLNLFWQICLMRQGPEYVPTYGWFVATVVLANMIGSCRETISRAFNQLARDGLIISRGRSMVVTNELMARTTRPRAA